MKRSVCFTSCNNAYLDRAAILAKTFKQHHGDWWFVVLLSDVVEASESISEKVPEIDEIVPINTLESIYSPSWTFKHDSEELCTAVKPFFAQSLLAKGVQQILYLDPDVVVLRRLHEVVERLGRERFLLTPHVWAPAHENQRHIEVNEISCLAHGIFNLGFFALRAGDDAKEVVDFWSDRLRKYCYRDHASGLFTDQKWANFFPVFFDCVHVIKERTLNISSWNLVNVHLVGAIPELYSDGTHIGFLHFSGVNSDVFTWAASEVGALTNTVASIFEWYKRALHEVRSLSFPASKVYQTYRSGRLIRKSHRMHYRSNDAFSKRYHDPYDDRGEESFFAREIAPHEEELVQIYENPKFIPRRY